MHADQALNRSLYLREQCMLNTDLMAGMRTAYCIDPPRVLICNKWIRSKETVRGRFMDSSIFTTSENEIFDLLHTDQAGLTLQDAKKRLEEVGRNGIEKKAGVPLWRKMITNFTHFFAIMLWLAAVLSFIGDMPELGYACIAVIIINGIFTFWQEFKAEKAIESLQKILPKKARVLRAGEEMEIDAE